MKRLQKRILESIDRELKAHGVKAELKELFPNFRRLKVEVLVAMVARYNGVPHNRIRLRFWS